MNFETRQVWTLINIYMNPSSEEQLKIDHLSPERPDRTPKLD